MPENRSETTYRRPASDVFPPAVALTRRLDTFSTAPSALPGRVFRPSHLLKISKNPPLRGVEVRCADKPYRSPPTDLISEHSRTAKIWKNSPLRGVGAKTRCFASKIH
ncbi:hypothetical protein C8R43DRAFT_1135662 [Mycena crocata]|nr:hypothetical protein C8R43DRAFT_1135662 [Mycena crocata]